MILLKLNKGPGPMLDLLDESCGWGARETLEIDDAYS